MTIEFQVEGMSCQHCVAAVTNAIREHDKAAQVQVDLASGRVAVESAQPAEMLKAAIDEAGYTVTGIANGEREPAAPPAKRVQSCSKLPYWRLGAARPRARRRTGAADPWQVVATAFSRPGPDNVALDIRDAQAVEQFVERDAARVGDCRGRA